MAKKRRRHPATRLLLLKAGPIRLDAPNLYDFVV